MDTEREQLAASAALGCDPFDVETISETIRRALRLGSGRPDPAELAAAQGELKGHLALLIPLARQEVRRLHRRGDETQARELAARLDGTEHRAAQELRPDVLAAHVQIGHLTRDCQYLLATHTAADWR
ncbi:DUF6415 family natural product biosynthesis protein [Streptomyces sp. NPDC048196]|uniref:DUF6415 family natural product biosynthesis protein n=1 Tax=Streptomyces sp. NPDC048196 TaxID=3154712 RepID=UPI0033EA0CA3